MSPDEFVATVLEPGIAWCKAVPAWNVPFNDRANALLLAIAGQESACMKAGVSASTFMVWGLFATAKGDDLATAFARLLLWSDSAPLPTIGDEEGAWEYYLRLWKPGKPSRERWAEVYPQAVAALEP